MRLVNSAIALGTFDGVHKGHLTVLNNALKSGFKAIAIAFSVPPRKIMNGEDILLTTPDKKSDILRQLGFDEIIYLDFEKIKDLSPLEFLEFLKEKYNPAVISCGFNYHFGKNGSGNIDYIEAFCKQNDIMLIKAEPVCENGKIVSSTYIRSLLAEGKIELANKLLYKPFGFSAEVIHGNMRGRTIGFPTINQIYPAGLAPVKFGVYKTRILLENREYAGITNIGVRPTFKNGMVSAETFIENFSGDIYGKTVDIRLIEFIREEKRFSSIDELKENIKKDIEKLH